MARHKLEDARKNLEALSAANDALTFRSAFNSFLSNARAVTYALQKQGNHIKGFRTWYEPKQTEMKNDQLLRFMHEARIEDFHEGRHRLSFSTRVERLAMKNMGAPPQAGARLGVGTDGVYWIVDRGTPNERRIPVKRGASYVISVSILNGPRTHRGKRVEQGDPVTVCQLCFDYLQGLLHEASARFGGC